MSLVIGISGGTGSGKTRFAKELKSRCDNKYTNYISQDSYYKDLTHLPYEERCKNNFDSPKSIDFDLLYKNLSDLLKLLRELDSFSLQKKKKINLLLLL